MKVISINTLFNPELNYDLRDDIVSDMIHSCVEKENEIFEKSLRTMAVPPIKGQITKGKLRNRGITLHIINDCGKISKQLYQRGEAISPLISIDFKYELV